ncbi:hypothetical protein NliqN6_0431 [Naganishia liquefaciens]|uniref:Methyltransferase n=1 Tax=Naganishia liquefaciens TaxID=104408 RepID=A0A8H3TNC8_9TREE|nr:hypothetical protein NliqN6_0431 [Naganishia liquefaciens]
MIPTPDYGKLHDSVYEPAEDSFILLDALEQDLERIRSSEPTICLEIGSGSGIASAFLANAVGPSTALFLSTDINPNACSATQNTSHLNKVNINPVRASLVDPLLARIRAVRGVDVLLFNPPYVPTEELELLQTQQGADIGATWAGGLDGMKVTDIILDLLPELLQPRGVFYLVAVSENNPQQICQTMKGRGFEAEVALKRRAGRELLHVLKIVKPAGE